jgi:hypothetical protein
MVSLFVRYEWPEKATILFAEDGNMCSKVTAQHPRIDEAVPFTTTPSHRIMVPSDGDDMTIKAVDLKLGSWVMCSDDMAKKVKGMRFIHASGPRC